MLDWTEGLFTGVIVDRSKSAENPPPIGQFFELSIKNREIESVRLVDKGSGKPRPYFKRVPSAAEHLGEPRRRKIYWQLPGDIRDVDEG